MTRVIDDNENPEWTEADFARAKPAKEVLPPKLFEALTRKPGRPKKIDAKQPVTLRLDPVIISHFKSAGDGWQTRINDVLLEVAQGRRPAAPGSRLAKGGKKSA